MPKPEAHPSLPPEQKGDVYMARKMYREAVEAYREGPADSPVLVNKIGIAYHLMLDLRHAQSQYERAVKLKPDYAEAVNNLGTIFYVKKSYRRATTQYKRALRITPESASIMSNLGTVYFARKKYKEAAEMYRQALALDPEIFEHRSTTGSLLIERSTEERAKFHFYLAKTYAHAGQNERALIYLRKAMEEGLKERDKLKEVPEFATLRDTQEFQELLTYKPKVL